MLLLLFLHSCRMLLLLFLPTVALAFEFPCGLGKYNAAPSQVFMSTFKSHETKPQNCADDKLETFCQSKNEENPFFVLHFDIPVEVLSVHIKTNPEVGDLLGNLTIFVTDEAPKDDKLASSGKILATYAGPQHPSELLTFAPVTPPHKPRAGMVGTYVVIQKSGKSTTLSMSEVGVCAEPAEYIPGTPGGPWTAIEVNIVQEKLRYLFKRTVTTDEDIITDEKFPPITNEVWTADWSHKKNFTYNRRKTELGFTTRKMIQLAFHDCLKYIDGTGGCDGCLNWREMDNLHEEPPGNMGSVREGQPHYRAEPVQKATDNNKLSTSAMVLEWIYKDPTWPPGAPELPISLRSSGKSRADLWQFAANVAMEIELVKSNWGCQHRNNYNWQVNVLEGLDKCLIKLHKPIPFQHGRKDCIQDAEHMKTDFEFEATKPEHHPNPHGSSDKVLELMKDEFGISASQTIALMACHGLAPQDHNTNIKNQYRWPGSPFLSNMYHKSLAGRPLYNTGAWLNEGQWDAQWTSTLNGDADGNPIHGDIIGGSTLECKKWWNTTNPDSGPCFLRPLNVNVKGMSPEHPEWLPRIPCFQWNFTTESYEKLSKQKCSSATIDPKTGVQKGGEVNGWYNPNHNRYSFAFFLTFEGNFVNNFTVDEENHPRGCNIPDELWDEGGGFSRMDKYEPVTCGPNMFKLPGEQMTSTEITMALADDHDLWEHEFLDGWAQLQKNGYGDELYDGPENSWIGYSLIPEGTPIEFPLLFGQDFDPDAEDYITYRGDDWPNPKNMNEVID